MFSDPFLINVEQVMGREYPRGMSKKYVDELNQKQKDLDKCRENAILEY